VGQKRGHYQKYLHYFLHTAHQGFDVYCITEYVYSTYKTHGTEDRIARQQPAYVVYRGSVGMRIPWGFPQIFSVGKYGMGMRIEIQSQRQAWL